jgi:hypothetical protein
MGADWGAVQALALDDEFRAGRVASLFANGTAAPDVSDEVTPARPCVLPVHKPKTIIFALEADTGNTRDLVPTTNATYCFPPTA